MGIHVVPKIICVGISFKTAGLEVREKFALDEPDKQRLITFLKGNRFVREALVLSTCNRTEIYVSVTDGVDIGDYLIDSLLHITGVPEQSGYEKRFYTIADKAAVEHLFRVTAGLDSLVLGERQILGQFRETVNFSREQDMLGRQFNILSDLAIRVGKKAQNETEISRGGSSVSWAAVAMAEKKLGGLKGKSVLVIGAGKMSKINLSLLRKKGAERVYVISRCQERARRSAVRHGAEVIPASRLQEVLGHVDLCLCSASSREYVLRKEEMLQAVKRRGGRRLVLIDISVPRNIDPRVGTIAGVKLLVVDELKKMVAENQGRRRQAVRAVEKIIRAKLDQYTAKMQPPRLIAVG